LCNQLFSEPETADGERDFWPRAWDHNIYGGGREAHRLFELEDGGTGHADRLLDGWKRRDLPARRRQNFCAFWKTAGAAAWGKQERDYGGRARSRQQPTRSGEGPSAAGSGGTICTSPEVFHIKPAAAAGHQGRLFAAGRLYSAAGPSNAKHWQNTCAGWGGSLDIFMGPHTWRGISRTAGTYGAFGDMCEKDLLTRGACGRIWKGGRRKGPERSGGKSSFGRATKPQTVDGDGAKC